MTLLQQRSITLIRHAKSSWDDPAVADFDRSLNKRGADDAPRVGEALQQAGVSFDRVLCSDAQRARETLSLLRTGIDIAEDIIDYRHDMYGASASHLLSCITEQPDFINNIALVGHNPGMEDLANSLADEPLGSMSTCCVIQLTYECDSWRDIVQARAEISLNILPREL